MSHRHSPAVVVALLLSAPAGAQPSPTPPPAPSPAAATEVAPDSPRASVAEFLDLTREGRYAAAAAFLDVPEVDASRAPELARRLKAVLDRHLWLDLDLVSARPEGDPADGLPPHTDQLGAIPFGARGEAVRLTRREGHPAWAFSRPTVERIERWYDALPDRWVRDKLPEVLLRPGPRELLRWQWIALVVVALVSVGVGWLLAAASRAVLGVFTSRTRTTWDEALLRRVGAPLVAVWSLSIFYMLLPSVGLYAPAQSFILRSARAAGALTLFWVLWRAVAVASDALGTSRWALASPSSRSVILIGARLARILVAAAGAITALSALGYPVAGLLAGLGIGGLALAFAAQKTLENLFGSIALAVDQPIRVGDFVKVEDFVGTVEAVGLRSTRFRTLDRTLVSIPNGLVADMRLESYTARDRMRLACVVGVVYGTTAAQMRAVLEGLEATLRAHPKIWPDAVVVRFKELGPHSLDVEVMAWFQTADWSEFQLIRQEILLQFMEVVERAGTSFAFPTRTVHLVTGGAAPSPAAAPDGEAREGA